MTIALVATPLMPGGLSLWCIGADGSAAIEPISPLFGCTTDRCGTPDDGLAPDSLLLPEEGCTDIYRSAWLSLRPEGDPEQATPNPVNPAVYADRSGDIARLAQPARRLMEHPPPDAERARLLRATVLLI